MRCGDNCGDLDGVSSVNDDECPLEQCSLIQCYVGMLIAIEFIFSLLFYASNLARYFIGMSDMETNGMSIEWMSARWWHSRPLSMNWQWKNLMEIFHRVLACHNEMEPQWYCRSVGGQNWVRGSGGELTNSIFNTTMKWEMGETTIGVIPYYNSESAVDILHGRVHHIQSKGGTKI